MKIDRIIEYLLDTIAPPDPFIRDIENMSLAQFKELATKNVDKSKKAGDKKVGIKNVDNETIAFFPYRNDVIRATLVELKDFRNKKLERMIGKMTCDCLIEHIKKLQAYHNENYDIDGNMNKDFSNPLLIPVPMTKKSLRKRGWNQCELIINEIEKADDKKIMEKCFGALIKIKETKDQVGKNREERFENLRECFAVKKDSEIKGRNVIVLDDIVTTGATLGEAERALLKSGARAVICVAVAS